MKRKMKMEKQMNLLEPRKKKREKRLKKEILINQMKKEKELVPIVQLLK